MGHLPGDRVDVRQQPVAQPFERLQGLLGGLVELPELLTWAGAMHAEHGRERAELEPAHKQFLVFRVLRIPAEEAADIGVPVRNAADGEVQARGNLLPEDVPGAVDIAGPRDGRVALLPGVCGTGEDDDPLPVRLGALALVDAGRWSSAGTR